MALAELVELEDLVVAEVLKVQLGQVHLMKVMLADLVADQLRHMTLVALGVPWSGLRLHVGGTLLAVFLAWLVVLCFVHDAQLVPLPAGCDADSDARGGGARRWDARRRERRATARTRRKRRTRRRGRARAR